MSISARATAVRLDNDRFWDDLDNELRIPH
jgi:hypothetical protein